MLSSRFIPAYVNLADLYRSRGRDAESESILRDGLKMTPNNAMLRHALGLALVRLKRTDAALGELRARDRSRTRQCALCVCLRRDAALSGQGGCGDCNA